jgi:hypothetical protein
MKIYLDVCCLCRPFDDQKVNRIHLEAEAIKEILVRCTRDWTLVTSDAVSFEISRILDKTRMKKALNLLGSRPWSWNSSGTKTGFLYLMAG